MISELEKQLYADDDNPRIHILEPKMKELADRYSCELFSAYIDKYRPYGVNEMNAVLWKEPEMALGSPLGATPGLSSQKTPASAMAIPDLKKWSARAEVIRGGAWAMLNIPDCQAAIHELMHVEEYPPNSYLASEVMTVMRDLINLDAIYKRILGSPIDTEVPYKKSLKITSSLQGFSKTCSIPLGKFINFYRDLEQWHLNLGEAIASPQSIHFLTDCHYRLPEYESLAKSVQGGQEFEAALNYVKKHIGSTAQELQKSALFLLKELVKQGESEPFAMETVIKSIERLVSSGIKDEVPDLLKELLIHKKQSHKLSEHIINNIKNRNHIINSIIVMTELVKHGNFDEAFALETGIAYSYYPCTSDLLTELFRKNKGFGPAIEYVNANIKSEDPLNSHRARELLIQLVKYGKIEESFAMAVLKNSLSA